jgi:hypothetical protein
MAETATPKATDAELAVAYRGPAVLANRFYVSLGSSGVRIAFAEQSSPATTPIFRSAVTLSSQDGATLCKLLQTLLKDAEPQPEKLPEKPEIVSKDTVSKPKLAKAND